MLGGVFEQEKKYDQAEDEFKQVLTLNHEMRRPLNYTVYCWPTRPAVARATDLVKRALAEDRRMAPISIASDGPISKQAG